MEWKEDSNGQGSTDWKHASEWFEQRSKQIARGEIPETSAQQERMAAERKNDRPLQEDRLPIRPRERQKKQATVRQFRKPAEKSEAQRRYEKKVEPKKRTGKADAQSRLSADEKRRAHAEKSKKNRRIRRIAGAISACVIAVTVGVLLSLFVLFGIENVAVAGDCRYSSQEIIAASGVELGENIWRVDKDAINSRVCEALSYIGNVKCSVDFPATLVLNITETAEKYALPYSKNYVLLNEDGKVLSRIAKKIPSGVIELSGVSFAQADVGKTIALAQGSEDKLALSAQILSATEKNNIEGINKLNLENLSAIYLVYQNRIKLYLGGIARLEDKLSEGSKLLEILDSENKTYTGVANLSVEGNVYFKPGSVDAQATSAEAYKKSLEDARKAVTTTAAATQAATKAQ